MSIPEDSDPTEDIKIHWVDIKFFSCFGASKVLDEERKQPAERAEVFAIDLHTASVVSALGWAKHFRDGLSSEDPPVCVVVYGREIKPEEQEQFALAGVHAIDVFREDLGLRGPSHAMLIDLIRSVVVASPTLAATTSPFPPRPIVGRLAALLHPAEPCARLGPERPVRGTGEG